MSVTRTNRLISFFAATALALVVGSASAEEDSKPEKVLEKAQATFDMFINHKDLDWARENMPDAKGVFIVPRVIEAAFLVGGSGGSGALLIKDEETGEWSEPAFFTMGSGSIGLQIGGKVAQTLLMIMSQKGVDAFQKTKFQLGADLAVTTGPVGGKIQGATADAYAYSLSKGAFLGMSLEGAVISPRDKWNEAFYGKAVTPSDILIARTVSNPQSSELRSALAKASVGTTKTY